MRSFFFSAPYLGSLSDRIGRRKILIVSIASSALGWFIFAKAGSVLMLFVGRIIDGLAAGNITTAQSTLADIARNDKERTANLGLFGAMFGLGFILGPTLGGILASHGTATPFYFVTILASANAIFAFFFYQKRIPGEMPTRKLSSIHLHRLLTDSNTKQFKDYFLFGFYLLPHLHYNK